MIPRELGHIWVGVFPAPDIWMKTWKDKHPDWSYRHFLRRHKFEKDLTIFPSHYFIPEHYNGEKYQGDDKIYAHQLWGTTSKKYPHSNGKHGLSREEIQEKIGVILEGLQSNLTN